VVQVIADAHHILDWHTFCNADDQRDTCIGSFEHGVGRGAGGHKNTRAVCIRCIHGEFDGIEHRDFPIQDPFAPFAGRHTGDDVRAIGVHLRGMEETFVACHALDEQAGIFIDQYAHEKISP
jgi:hypothetical protein